VTDDTPVKGPYTFARLRELWSAGRIGAESKLFLTERDEETNKVKCFNLRVADIMENLESGREVDVDGLSKEHIIRAVRRIGAWPRHISRP
jgi:hypothetical protein